MVDASSSFQKWNSDSQGNPVASRCLWISAIEKLDLFVTCGNDGTIRVWDGYNSLLREMQLDEPIHGLCILNSRGDIVVAVRDRLDLLPFSSYLPPGYCKTAQLLESNITIEETIPFDETPQLSIPKRFTFTLDEQRPWPARDVPPSSAFCFMGMFLSLEGGFSCYHISVIPLVAMTAVQATHSRHLEELSPTGQTYMNMM
ncbi:hypothetical protein SeMB42_g00216 [Synchytrium endobioticum]|uniref:Uncharacterized protein n=1 Tax=Synchytrium endobioticum TaxID=286115 RepID=A0A507DSL7_9FUNG|nr:hypothetical protein SeMB42_g00216 [Synchytrium endobioticum]